MPSSCTCSASDNKCPSINNSKRAAPPGAENRSAVVLSARAGNNTFHGGGIHTSRPVINTPATMASTALAWPAVGTCVHTTSTPARSCRAHQVPSARPARVKRSCADISSVGACNQESTAAGVFDLVMAPACHIHGRSTNKPGATSSRCAATAPAARAMAPHLLPTMASARTTHTHLQATRWAPRSVP
jgi:hypothetical protein